jgi:hypothetical protein
MVSSPSPLSTTIGAANESHAGKEPSLPFDPEFAATEKTTAAAQTDEKSWDATGTLLQ